MLLKPDNCHVSLISYKLVLYHCQNQKSGGFVSSEINYRTFRVVPKY